MLNFSCSEAVECIGIYKFYTEYEVQLYLWWVVPVGKHFNVAKYFDDDSRLKASRKFNQFFKNNSSIVKTKRFCLKVEPKNNI